MSQIKVVLAITLLLTFNLVAQQSWIRINQVGYTPESTKIAVLASKGNIAITSFEIMDVLTDKSFYKSKNVK